MRTDCLRCGCVHSYMYVVYVLLCYQHPTEHIPFRSTLHLPFHSWVLAGCRRQWTYTTYVVVIGMYMQYILVYMLRANRVRKQYGSGSFVRDLSDAKNPHIYVGNHFRGAVVSPLSPVKNTHTITIVGSCVFAFLCLATIITHSSFLFVTLFRQYTIYEHFTINLSHCKWIQLFRIVWFWMPLKSIDLFIIGFFLFLINRSGKRIK